MKNRSRWHDTKIIRNTGAGRSTIFQDYRLRVVSVLRDYGMNDRRQAPQGSVGGT
jgi:hypothetical protein